MRRFSRVFGQGKHSVEITFVVTAEGVIVEVLGGEKPHVGAVALGQPRPSLKDPGKISANVTVVPLLGHKDDEVAKPLADTLARHFNKPVVVVVGIHIDNASEQDIEILLNNVDEGVRHLIEEIGKFPT
ncbi:MAG: hypothetical protein H0Z39_06775 [Peptococcaceae bacterium]|nr:hypothetical protein [Peptococcaceae bacterium]